MAQPFPPQGEQQPYTEKPTKIYGEQYTTAGTLPAGATTETTNPLYADGRPHVITARGVYELHLTDWVVSNRYSGQPIAVLSDEEFHDSY